MAKSSTFFSGLGTTIVGTLGILNEYDERRAQRKFDLRAQEFTAAANAAAERTKIAMTQALVIGGVILGAVLILRKKKGR